MSASTARLQAAAARQGAANEEDAGNAELAFAVDLPPLGCVLDLFVTFHSTIFPATTRDRAHQWLSQPNCHRSGVSYDNKMMFFT